MALCECGCGGAIEPKRHHRWRGTPEYIRGHHPNSKVSRPTKGWIIRNGYRALLVGKGRYAYEHRLVMERLLGRSLTWHEVVHHRDYNRLNNDPANLELTTRHEHGAHHHEHGHDGRTHVHKHFDCECGKSTGLSQTWREQNREQRAKDISRGPDGKFRAI